MSFLPLTYIAVPPSEAKEMPPLLFTEIPGECLSTSKAFPISVRYDWAISIWIFPFDEVVIGRDFRAVTTTSCNEISSGSSLMSGSVSGPSIEIFFLISLYPNVRTHRRNSPLCTGKQNLPLLSVIVVSIKTLSGKDASITTAASSPCSCSSNILPTMLSWAFTNMA